MNIDLNTKKLLIWLTFVATITGIIAGGIAIYDRINKKPMWEQSIPLDELEKHRGEDGTIRIEKGIIITPGEEGDDAGSD